MSNKFSINQVEQLLKYTAKRKSNYKHFNLSLCAISCLLEDNNTENVLSYINKFLKSSRNDDEVYICLNSIIACVPKEILMENILFWTLCIVEKSNEKSAKRYDIISSLIEIGKENQEFNKLMHSSLLSKIIDECLSIEIGTIYTGSSLTCLATCLETYSSSCGHMKNKIEHYLIQFLYSKSVNSKLIKYAASCFQKLQTVGNPGIDAINYKNNWKSAFEKLCVTVDVLCDAFLEDVDEFYHYEKLTIDPYTLPELPKVISSIEVFYTLESRLANTCTFLRGMLENECRHPKCIQPQSALDIISRVLSLHICVDNNSDTMFHFGMLLIKSQISMLYLLRSIIAVLELNLLQFSATITKLLMDSLIRSKNCKCFKSATEYTQTVYKVLNFWIKTLGNCLNGNVHDKLVNLIITDISPITTDVSLNISNTKEGISGKAKKRAMQEKIISGPKKYSSLENYSKNMLRSKEQICYQALSCLSTLLTNVHLSIKDNSSSLLLHTLVQGILSIQNGKKLFPYSSDNIKIKLFEALVASLECSKLPSSIALIINILREGQKTNNAALLHTCSVGLNLLEKICQPVCPSLNFDTQNRFMPKSDEMVEEFVEISKPSIESTNGDEETCEIQELIDSEPFTEKVCSISDVIINDNLENDINRENLEININTDSTVEITNKEIVPNVSNIAEELPLSEQPIEENTDNKKEVDVQEDTEIVSHHSDVEHDCAEPAQKKLKMHISSTDSDIDIEEMLSSFVDEISDDIK